MLNCVNQLVDKGERAVVAIRMLSTVYKNSLSHLGREKKQHASSQQLAFRILIGTILSHRTRDEKTEIATQQLLAKFPSPKKLAAASTAQIITLIKPVGFYNSKARYVKECSRQLVERFSGIVPQSMEELTSLTGVGRKTAGCVIAYAFEGAAIPVDSHVHQVANRLGIVKTKTPLQTEFALMEIIPRKHWKEVNEVFVVHGQKTCVPLSPFCSRCPLSAMCSRVGVKKAR